MLIREERPGDAPRIHEVVAAAFAGAEHASGREAELVDALRAAGALVLSLVAELDGAIGGHIAFSAVAIGDAGGWLGLGPLAVAPEQQRRGIGAALVHAGLERLRARGARGCVLVGEPAYYGRFGFAAFPALTYAGVPPEYVLALPFTDERPTGEAVYHPAFSAFG
jgi:putative acetyltransferase